MREKIHALTAQWNEDKLYGSLYICWIATVLSSFFRSAVLSFSVPAIGEIYPFRIFLPITLVLYILYSQKNKYKIWENASALERWCYALILIMLVYGTVSLLRALDFAFTLKRLINLCFDLIFFFLVLQLCLDKRLRSATLTACAVGLATMCIMGIWEIFMGGIFSNRYAAVPRYFLFNRVFNFPVVAAGNTNDYAATLLYCFAGLLPFIIIQWKNVRKPNHWLIVISFSIVYFVLLGCSARLATVGFWILFTGFVSYFLIADKRRLWIPLLIILFIGCNQFAYRYRYIAPQVQTYLAELKEYREQTQSPTLPESPIPEKPSLQIEDPRTPPPLKDEFFKTDEETGEMTLQESGSASVRARLLIHAFQCFKESHGLGIGLGNTETLAPQRGIVQGWKDRPQNSIHCFIARIVADFGIFVLIPLCVIGFILLQKSVLLFRSGVRQRNRNKIGGALFFLSVICMYPFLSTASSDSQDCIAMWIYLGLIVLFCRISSDTHNEEEAV